MFGAMIGTWYKGHKGWLQEREWSDALNKKEGKAKGINAEVMRPLWKLMHTAAKKSTPPGLTPFLLLDRAPAHTAKATAAELDCVWGKDNWALLPAKSPDLTLTDAALFPNMERNIQKHGATTKDEIRVAVRRVWDELTPASIAAMEKRLLRNEAEVIKRHGKNFYDESRL